MWNRLTFIPHLARLVGERAVTGLGFVCVRVRIHPVTVNQYKNDLIGRACWPWIRGSAGAGAKLPCYL